MSAAALESRDVLLCPACGATYGDGIRFCKIDGTALAGATGDPLIGTVIAGRYVIERKLGEGGMGTVYAAEHALMRRKVALKVVRESLAHDPTTAARFVREARVVSRLAAPEIVQVFDSGATDDGRLFLAMELLEGETLRQRLSRGPLPIGEAVHIGSAILRALSVAHGAGVVHRDLKPDNVFLCQRGQVKVLDFGIARLLGASEEPVGVSVTATGAIMGTALYLSPEAVSHEKVGPPGDLYSFGAMFFEMLAGKPPFFDEHPVLLMGMHLRVPAPRLSDATGIEQPAAVEDLIARLLAKQPGERPELGEVLSTLTAPLEPMTPQAPRRWPRVLLAMLALVIGAGGAIGLFAFLAEPPQRVVAPPRPPRIAALPPEPVAPVIEQPVVEPQAPARMMTLRGVFAPPSAWAELDGVRIELPHEMPADGAEHTLLVQAEGYAPNARTFTAERDRDVDLVLTRRSHGEPHVLVQPPQPRALVPTTSSPPTSGGLYRNYP